MYRIAKWKLIYVGVVLAMVSRVHVQTMDVSARMASVLAYTGIENAAPGDVARMAALWSRAQEPGLAREDRRIAFRDMYLLYGKLHGRDLSARPQALDGLAQFVTSTFEAGRRQDGS